MESRFGLRPWTAVVVAGLIWPASACGAEGSQEADAPRLSKESLVGKRFKFSWQSADGGALNGVATLNADGLIDGIRSPNESTWSIDRHGKLVFKHADGRISTRFEVVKCIDGALRFEGPFLLRDGVAHHLAEVDAAHSAHSQRITPPMAKRIKYSKQQFVYLDVGESFVFRLHSGTTRTIRLKSVEEYKDSVIALVRLASIVIEVDGQPLTLHCAPNVMPARHQGIRILADTTSAWMEMPRRVQFSVWDAKDPIVDTGSFGFPLTNYSLFSHGVQAYNEPVHLGHRDGDPAGQRFYHNYGVDLAGYEGRQEVISCIDGVVVQALRQDGTLSIQDDCGFIVVYGHLDSILDGLTVGTRVRRGQQVGVLGRRGASGNFSHLHVGTYLSESAMVAGRMNRNLNLYPWLVAAYRAESGVTLQAVARPHHIAKVGELVILDGRNSWARDEEIASYQWRFHDGTTFDGAVARKAFEKPGCYMARLRISDSQGRHDIDFCRIKVFSAPDPEPVVPTLFLTRAPAGPVRPGQQIEFRIWPQGADVHGIEVDVGGQRRVQDYQPYSVIAHVFTKPGRYVVSVSGASDGMPITQQAKIVVRD